MALGTLTKVGSFDNDDLSLLNGNFSFLQVTGFPNYVATESGGNNAIVFTLLDANGNYVPLAAGLRVMVKLAHTLQAGANTANMNGFGTKSILSHFNTSNNIGTAYAATGIIDMVYNGTAWQDLSQ